MRTIKAILILLFYTTSIFGYCFMDFSHFLAHQFKNPFHHHAVKHHHHHNFDDHKTSKLLTQSSKDFQKSVKVVKALYFCSVYEPSLLLEAKHHFIGKPNSDFLTISIFEIDFCPPSPPPERA